MTSGGENRDKRCRDFVRRQNRGVRKICRGKKTKVSRPLYFHILAEGGDVIDGRIVDILLELAEASWQQSVSLCP